MTFHESLPGCALGVLVVAIIGFALGSVRLVARGIRLARPLDIIRGIRLLVLALAASFAAVGVASGTMGFVVVGAIILAEELYETGLVAAIIRFGDRTVSPTPATGWWRCGRARAGRGPGVSGRRQLEVGEKGAHDRRILVDRH
jgi:hypothetical protein